jgi:hypothetical protein
LQDSSILTKPQPEVNLCRLIALCPQKTKKYKPFEIKMYLPNVGQYAHHRLMLKQITIIFWLALLFPLFQDPNAQAVDARSLVEASFN